LVLKNLKRIIAYFSSPINLQNGRQQIVINCGGLSLDKIYFQGCHWSIQFTNYIPAVSLEKTDFQSERKRVDYGLKLKVYIVYIWIKLSGFKVFLSKVPSLGVIQ